MCRKEKQINKNGFNHIVGLGYNCEVSYRIQEYGRQKIDSYPLSWAYVTEQKRLIYILDNLNMLLSEQLKLLPDGMLYCEKLGLEVHTKLEKNVLEQILKEEKEKFIKEATVEVRNRFSHLIKKWNLLLKSDESTLFVIKCQEIYNVEETAMLLEQLVVYFEEHYVSKKFFILAVTDSREKYLSLSGMTSTHVGVAYVRKFAERQFTMTGGDRRTWLGALEHFNHIWDDERNSYTYQVDEDETLHEKDEPDLYMHSHAEYEKIKSWCDELQRGKDWLEEENKRLRDYVQNREEAIRYLEEQKDIHEKMIEELQMLIHDLEG